MAPKNSAARRGQKPGVLQGLGVPVLATFSPIRASSSASSVSRVMISDGPGALEGKPPSVADYLEAAREDILAFTPFPPVSRGLSALSGSMK